LRQRAHSSVALVSQGHRFDALVVALAALPMVGDSPVALRMSQLRRKFTPVTEADAW